MKKKTGEAVQPSEAVYTETAEETKTEVCQPEEKQVFKVNPGKMTSIVTGNQVLFLGKGVHEITLM